MNIEFKHGVYIVNGMSTLVPGTFRVFINNKRLVVRTLDGLIALIVRANDNIIIDNEVGTLQELFNFFVNNG